MAEPTVMIGGPTSPTEEAPTNVEMAGHNTEVIEVLESAVADDAIAKEVEEEEPPPRITFIDYLRSPIIEIVVGAGDAQTLLTAHQALLVQSPFFASAVAQFSPEATTRRIEFATEDLDAMGCFLQFLYTGEYFPKKTGDMLERIDGRERESDDGDQLLKHARVYTLAEKLGVKELKALAHSKVHRVNSTARGEIEYARFVYANTPREDTTIRRPIASFWGQRSHVLRHEAESEFKKLCLEFPEYGFDVLSYVLDAREKKAGERAVEEPKSGRKRQRNI